MACDITLIVDDVNLQPRCLTYMVQQEVTYQKVITTLDGKEHAYPGHTRPILSFTLLPGTDEEDAALYGLLKKLIFTVTFTMEGRDVTRNMRLVSDLESTFLLRSVDGKRRYKSAEIVLRGI